MLYPLKVDKLDVPPGATASYVGFSAGMNVIGKPAKLTGVYARPKEPAAPKADKAGAAPAPTARPAAAPPRLRPGCAEEVAGIAQECPATRRR